MYVSQIPTHALLLKSVAAVMSVLSSMRYCLSDSSDLTHLWRAFALMPLALFFDFFDGKVARWREKSSLMGQELDSLADLVRTHFHIFYGNRG